jgi:hypothetical protein
MRTQDSVTDAVLAWRFGPAAVLEEYTYLVLRELNFIVVPEATGGRVGILCPRRYGCERKGKISGSVVTE